MIRDFAGKKPILGICLGHQAIAEVFGGKLGLAPKVMHGKQSNISFEAPSVLYQGIEDGRAVMRYHSILIEEMPEEFEVTARSTDDQAIMGIQHKKPSNLMDSSTIQKVSERQMACLLFGILSRRL